jgi:hypothetical protein
MLLPKVANTSIKLAILKAYGRKTDKIHAQGVFECVSTKEAKRFRHRIAFVRDPLARLASCWKDKIVVRTDGRFLPGLNKLGFSPGMDFEDFVERVASIPDDRCGGAAHHFRSMSYSLCDGDGIVPNLVGRFETIDEDWGRVQELFRKIGGPELPALTHERRTDSFDRKYSPRARALALQRFAKDVRVFRYRPWRKYEIDPDSHTRGRSICNVHREAYRVARDSVSDPVVGQHLMELMEEAFDMGKRMNARLGGSQYEE